MSSDTIYTIVSVIYIMVCLFLIMVVLLQSGKGGGMGALGGGASGGQTVFGGAGAGNFLTRLTAICAALFMLLSATLAYLSTKGETRAKEGLLRQEQAAASVTATDSSGDEESPEPPTTVPPVEEPTAVDGITTGDTLSVDAPAAELSEPTSDGEEGEDSPSEAEAPVQGETPSATE